MCLIFTMSKKAVANWGHRNICNKQHVENSTSPLSVFLLLQHQRELRKKFNGKAVPFFWHGYSKVFQSCSLEISKYFVMWQHLLATWLFNIFQNFDFFWSLLGNSRLIFLIYIIYTIVAWSIVNWGAILSKKSRLLKGPTENVKPNGTIPYATTTL